MIAVQINEGLARVVLGVGLQGLLRDISFLGL